MPARIRRDETGIVTFGRRTFFDDVWDYTEGDCVTILAPYGGGKTQIGFEALAATATPELPATVFVMKPRDKTVDRFARANEYLITRNWPPPRPRRLLRIGQGGPAGYILWPDEETGDPDIDDRRQTAIFRRAIRMMYKAAGERSKRKRRPSIIFCDETYSLEHELGLAKDLRRVWTKGRSVGCGLWAASQRPVWISRWALQAQHLFLAYDPDLDMQKRYGEIGGGLRPEIVSSLVAQLERFQFLYINREERAMCIVDAN